MTLSLIFYLKGVFLNYVIRAKYTVVGDSNNIMKTTFLFKFYLLTSFFLKTSLQVINNELFQLTASLCFHVLCVTMLLKSLK